MRSAPAVGVPFWSATDMTAEPLVFVAGDAGDDGPAAARLLFSPSGDVLVAAAAGEPHYTEGVDFTVDRRARSLLLTAGSRIPFIRADVDTLAGVDEMRAHTVTATYTHAGDIWQGYVPPASGHRLPRTRTRLQHGQPVCVGILGDSISEGYDASGFHGVPPNEEPYARLLADMLTARCQSPVTVCNGAVAGSASDDGRWLTADMGTQSPDLVIVAFGMNDACHAAPSDFASNVADILRRLADVRPQAEFVLVSPMRPTPACTWVDHERFTPYRDALHALSRTGVAVADVTAVWDAVLTRKHPYDLSGNGTNHPNDFGHLLYAQTIIRTLAGPTGVAVGRRRRARQPARRLPSATRPARSRS